MKFINRLFRLIAEYFVFLGGFLFIFVLGAIYAFLRLEGIITNVVFLIIALGWILFLLKYFWDLIEKKEASRSSQADGNIPED